MWKTIKNFINNSKKEKDIRQDSDIELYQYNQYNSAVPLDELFATNFNAGGGHFLYCENATEALENLYQIIQYEKTEPIICLDPTLQNKLEEINIKYTTSPSTNPNEFSFLKCEFLCAYDGSIMISSHQTNGRKIEDFPSNFIIWADSKQFANNLSDGLHKLKTLKNNNLPSNITCIRGKDMHSFNSIPNAKNIYLLLVDNIS